MMKTNSEKISSYFLVSGIFLYLMFAFLFLCNQALTLSLIQGAPGTESDVWLKSIFAPPLQRWLPLLALSSTALFASFLGLLYWASSTSIALSRFRFIHLFLGPALILASSFLFSPVRSIDLFSYVVHGYLSQTEMVGAYLKNVADVASTPFGQSLKDMGWMPVHGPSPYGPVWTLLEIAAVKITGSSPYSATLVLKLVSMFSFLGTGFLIYKLALRLAPQNAYLASMLFLWNPFFLIELGPEAHNDSLMLFFILLALYGVAKNKWVCSWAALTLSVLCKYIPIIAFPALLKLIFFQDQKQGRLKTLAICVGTTALFLTLFYFPFGFSKELFGAVQNSANGYPFSVQLISTSLAKLGLMGAANAFPFFIKLVLFALILRSAQRARDVAALISEWALIFGFYFFIVSPAYWSWYLALPAVLFILCFDKKSWIFVLSASFCALVAAPLWHLGVKKVIPLEQGAYWHQILGLGVIAALYLVLIFIPNLGFKFCMLAKLKSQALESRHDA